MHDTEIIKNFLSPEQVSKLKELVDNNPETEIVNAPVGRYLGVTNDINTLLHNAIKKLPCSDNYVANNLGNKKGFVIWSEFAK